MVAPPPFDAGKRFEVRRALGEGGMGVVFEAYDRERQQLVALKTIRSVDARTLARFKREFRALHDLTHPNLVSLGELFDTDTEPFFTMELIRGGDFLEHVRGESGRDVGSTPSTRQHWPSADEPSDGRAHAVAPLPTELLSYDEERLRSALKQLALAVEAVHGAGLVHRDIKPSNVLVTTEGRVVLLDFGLVTHTSSATAPTFSSQVGAVGTVAYMAPEQAMSGNTGPEADWYSVGVLLFEALTGALPHSGRTAFDVILRKQKFPAPRLDHYAAFVPADLDALCMSLLETAPASRPSARQIFDQLAISAHDAATLDAARPRAKVSGTDMFVGRASELQQLAAAYTRSRQAPAVALVEGVSGIGKTQLVEAFVAQLVDSNADAVILTGRCYEREVVSYKAFDGIADTLARYLGRLPRVEVAGFLPMHAALLSRLFPVLRRVEAIATAPQVDDAPDPQEQRRRMFAALRELFSRIAERRPLVCFIDDLQWTDADSLILLQDLLSGEEPPPLLLIATVRPVADEARRSLVRSIEELAPTTRIRVSELSRVEALALAELLLPDRNEAVHRAVAADAAGHPLFLHALARHISTSDESQAAGASLEEMLTSHIDAVPDSARLLLEVAALYGGPVSQEVAGRAAQMPHGKLTEAARMLQAAHLIRTDGVRRTDRLLTSHDRVREHVTRNLDEPRRKFVHERIAIALAQTDAATHDPRALVRHTRAAGQLSQAAVHAVTAARHAVQTLAFDQAAELFATALELGSYDEQTLRALRLDQASALVHAGRGPEAAAVLMRAAEGADSAVRLDCQRRAAEQWINTGHLDKGMEALRASLAEIGEALAATPRRALAHVVWNRIRLRVRGTRYRTRTENQVSVEALRRLDVLRTVAHGLAMVDFIRGADFNGRFVLQALRTGVPNRLVEALATEVVYLASQGGRAGRRARRLFGRIEALTDAAPNDPYILSWALMADGAAKFFEGRFAPADDALARCETMLSSRTSGTTAERNNARVFRVLATRHMGRWRLCRILTADAIRSGQQRGDRYLEATARLLRVPSLLASDDVAAARPDDDAVLWSLPESGYHVQHYYEYNANVELALYEGAAAARFDELRQAFERLRASVLFRVQLVRVTGLSLHGRLCLAAAAAGGPAEAVAEATRVARRLASERYACATVSGHLLDAGLAPHASEAALGALRRAIDCAEREHMALHAAAARDRLGILLGGDEGAALRAAAAGYASDEGIVRPETLLATVAPGVLGDTD